MPFQPAPPEIIQGDCREAGERLPKRMGKVALCVTSPPYHNAISYDDHAEDSTRNYRVRNTMSYADEYLPLMNEAWHACWEMLRPGGRLGVNVGTVLLDGYHFPLPQDIIAGGLNTDPWEYNGAIYWHKVTAGVKRAGSVIQKPYPGYWHSNIMTEHILLFEKPGGVTVENDDVPEEWWEPVWDLAPVPPGQVDHPAPFPEDLPHRLIRMFTNPGDAVMDPFNGAGATTKAAYDLGRLGIGFDLITDYIELAKRRIAEPSAVRSRQLRIEPVRTAEFVPGASRGGTRHGAGLGARRR